jgi:hypothetical protein
LAGAAGAATAGLTSSVFLSSFFCANVPTETQTASELKKVILNKFINFIFIVCKVYFCKINEKQ